MLDKIESRIANQLAEHHLYPFARNIYCDIFRAFSQFPLKLADIGMEGEGKTITFLALVIHECSQAKNPNFDKLFQGILANLQKKAARFFPHDITVETLLGCTLYYYHPSRLRNVLSSQAIENHLNELQQYEYEIKKNTILLYVV